MPALLGFLATLYITVGGLVVNTVFRLGQPLSAYIHMGLLVQTVLNVLLAPLVFWLYGWLKEKFQDPRRGFGG